MVGVLLMLGLVGPIRRAITVGTAPRSPTKVQQWQLLQEIEALRIEFVHDRATILKDIRSLQRANDHGKAMNLAARFYPLQDPELNALYNISASAESYRQRLVEYRNLIARECTNTIAQAHTIEYLRLQTKLEEQPRPYIIREIVATRLSGGLIRADIIKRLERRISDVTDDEDHRETDHNHGQQNHHKTIPRSRVHPNFIIALQQLRTGTEDELLCVWQVKGQRIWAGMGRYSQFELSLLLAPSANGTVLELELLSYAER